MLSHLFIKEKAKGLLSSARTLLQVFRGRDYLTAPFCAALVRVQCLPMASVVLQKQSSALNFIPWTVPSERHGLPLGLPGLPGLDPEGLPQARNPPLMTLV